MTRRLTLPLLIGAPLLLMAASCEEAPQTGVIDPGDDGAAGTVIVPEDDASGTVIVPEG